MFEFKLELDIMLEMTLNIIFEFKLGLEDKLTTMLQMELLGMKFNIIGKPTRATNSWW